VRLCNNIASNAATLYEQDLRAFIDSTKAAALLLGAARMNTLVFEFAYLMGFAAIFATVWIVLSGSTLSSESRC